MATVTIELTPRTAARLERGALRRGMDVPTYVRLLLGDEDRGAAPSGHAGSGHAVGRQPGADAADDSWLDVPESVVAAIRARGPLRSPVQGASADLAELPRAGGVGPGIPPAEWDRRWAAHEARRKALDLADTERTLRDMQPATVDAPTAVVAPRDGSTLLTTGDDCSAAPELRKENRLDATL